MSVYTVTPLPPGELTGGPIPEPVVIRPWNPDLERAMVMNHWLRSYESSPFGKSFSPGVFGRKWQAVVDGVIARSEVLCLCPADSPEATVYAWACWEPSASVLHYVHSLGKVRELGYASQLLAKMPDALTASHSTERFRRIAHRWDEDRAIVAGVCQCGAKLERMADRGIWICRRKASPGNPPCLQITRPSGYTPRYRKRITFDPTAV